MSIGTYLYDYSFLSNINKQLKNLFSLLYEVILHNEGESVMEIGVKLHPLTKVFSMSTYVVYL